MKNLFCIMNDYDSKKVKPVYEPFKTKGLTKAEQKKLSELSGKYETIHGKTKPSKWLVSLNRASVILFIIAVLFFVIDLIKDMGTKGFSGVLKADIFYFCVAILGLVLFIVCQVSLILLAKKKKRSGYKESAKKTFDEILDFSQKCLGVPKSSKNVEVLCEQINIKKGKSSSSKRAYSNVVLSVYVNKNILCFADLNNVISIPLNSLNSIQKVEEGYRFKSWHKEEDFRLEKYKDFNIKVSGYSYTAAYFYRVGFTHMEEEYEFYLPPYELEEFQSVLPKEIGDALCK